MSSRDNRKFELHRAAILVLSLSLLSAAAMTARACQPSIRFTSIPAYGSGGYACGRIHCADPLSYGIATYIFVEGSGWWTKPSFVQPITPIAADSTWCVDVATGGSDIYATRIRVALVPLASNPPQCGPCCAPPDLSGYALAEADTARAPRIVSFAGYQWGVKASVGPVGPGGTQFSDSTNSVWVDDAGLHLKLRKRSSAWYGAEVILRESFGYHCYSFDMFGPLGTLDTAVVVGAFTWDNDACPYHREMDIELLKNRSDTLNAQYVVQPWSVPGNLHRWDLPRGVSFAEHSLCWEPDSAAFQSWGVRGGNPVPSPLQSWTYVGAGVPAPGTENFRFNIWLQHGVPPGNGQEVEIVLRSFAVLDPAGVAWRDGASVSPIPWSIHPNPFRDRTTITYLLDAPGPLLLHVYTLDGILVQSLSRFSAQPGECRLSWPATDQSGRHLPSGVYYLQLQARGRTDCRKAVVIR